MAVHHRTSQHAVVRAGLEVPGGLELTALPSIGKEHWVPLVVDFSIFPHVDHEDLPDNSMAEAEKWAAALPVPGYAIDDQSAIKFTDGAVEVVPEGHWKLFTP